jgi:PAS domain-containing protein
MMDIGRTGVDPSGMGGYQENTGGQDEHSRIVDALPGLVWTALPDGQIDFLNQRWREYTGLNYEEACGLGWQAAIYPDDLA